MMVVGLEANFTPPRILFHIYRKSMPSYLSDIDFGRLLFFICDVKVGLSLGIPQLSIGIPPPKLLFLEYTHN